MVGLILLTGKTYMRVLSVICYFVYIFFKALGLYNYLLFKLRLGSKKLILLSSLLLQGFE